MRNGHIFARSTIVNDRLNPESIVKSDNPGRLLGAFGTEREVYLYRPWAPEKSIVVRLADLGESIKQGRAGVYWKTGEVLLPILLASGRCVEIEFDYASESTFLFRICFPEREVVFSHADVETRQLGHIPLSIGESPVVYP